MAIHRSVPILPCLTLCWFLLCFHKPSTVRTCFLGVDAPAIHPIGLSDWLQSGARSVSVQVWNPHALLRLRELPRSCVPQAPWGRSQGLVALKLAPLYSGSPHHGCRGGARANPQHTPAEAVNKMKMERLREAYWKCHKLWGSTRNIAATGIESVFISNLPP